MPGPQPTPINLTARQRALLERLVRRQTSPQRLARRAHQILLAASEGANNEQVADRLELTWGTVHLWRERWLAAVPRLEAAEAEGSDDKALAEAIEAVLADEPRPGAPRPPVLPNRLSSWWPWRVKCPRPPGALLAIGRPGSEPMKR